ncbi:PREDICTED: uncharacterized protein KIAA0947 homolog [Elephantulus edwardii]|uniref:uncharacterized protein KIAA0947 homolog n=1 Tax=Elephantulus edwardii TaxID=28737 RepID=UPI0003F080F3|nr:PREDICTED: uncharacterized protein KIAA0947 homolog [Elephantulus edwardii]
MMPGETRSAASGTAAERSRCQGCASLQQNLNEYVDALITLKQKIINTDNLLTEYQKKCDELQFARRENSTLHHQVEQMLQKISPLQKCQEELGSLKAELEEKKSSLKLYQETHQEYARVKEECLKSDAQKKKLEAKVKKLEDAASKQSQDFKQLRNEKKVLEKEFKKTQEKLDEFSKQKNEKELRHIGTQISSDSYGSIDKRKVKLLLKELWLCINTAQGLPATVGDSIPAVSVREHLKRKKLEEVQAVEPFLTAGNFPACKNMEEDRPSGMSHRGADRNPETVTASQSSRTMGFSYHNPCFDEDLQAAMDFFRLPPPLLSPVPSPPLLALPHLRPLASLRTVSPEPCYGEPMDSSEDDWTQHLSSTDGAAEEDSTEPPNYFGSFIRNKGSGTLFEQPAPHVHLQVTNTPAVNEVPTSESRASPAVLRHPPALSSLAMSSHFLGAEKADVEEAKIQVTVKEVDKAVQTDGPVFQTSSPRGISEFSSDSAAAGLSGLCPSPLSRRPPPSELSDSGRETLLSKLITSPQAEPTRQMGSKEIASESDKACDISELFYRVSQELNRGGEQVRGRLVDFPESEDESAENTTDASGQDVDAGFSPSFTSRALSVCSGPQASSGPESDDRVCAPSRGVFAEVPPAEQRPPLAASSCSSLQSKLAPEPESELEKSLLALKAELRVSNFSSQKSSAIEHPKMAKSTKTYPLPQPVFGKATGDEQHVGESSRTEHPLPMFDSQSAAGALEGLAKPAVGFGESSSQLHSDVLRRNSEGSLRANSEHGQETAQSREDGKSERSSELCAGCTSVRFSPASMLLNQVSVITKQAKSELDASTPAEAFPAPRSAPALAVDSGSAWAAPHAALPLCGGEEEGHAHEGDEGATEETTSPGGSPTAGQGDPKSPGSRRPAEGSPCSTNCRLSFSLENMPIKHLDTVMEASGQEDLEEPGQPLPPTPPAKFRVNFHKLSARETTPAWTFASEEASQGHTGTSCPEPTAASRGSPRRLQNFSMPLSLQSKTPRGSSSDDLATNSIASLPAFGRKDGETQTLSQSGLLDPLCCYTGLRERVEEDTEVEESSAFSCSEAESDPGPVLEGGQQEARHRALTHSADTEVSAAQTGPAAEVGQLTSALQDVNLSALSDIDALSTSEVVSFLESCQLRDYSSGDCASECSGKGALTKEMSRELKGSEFSGEQLEKGEEEVPDTCEGSFILDEDYDPLANTSLLQCSLETLSEVLTTMGPELQAHCEDSNASESGNLLFLDLHTTTTEEGGKGGDTPLETDISPPDTSELPPLTDSRSPPPRDEPPDEACGDIPEDDLGAARQDEGLAEGRLTPIEPEPLDSCLASEQRAPEQKSDGIPRQLSATTSKVISVLINKDQSIVIGEGDNWTVLNGVAVVPRVDQVILCDTSGDTQAAADQEGEEASSLVASSVEKSSGVPEGDSPFQEPQGGGHPSCTQEDAPSSGLSANFDKSRLRNRPVKPSVRISSLIYSQDFESQDFESQVIASDHTYYNSRLEPCSKNKNRAKIPSKDPSAKPGKTSVTSRTESNQSEASPSSSGELGGSKTLRTQTQPIVASADTSTPLECSSDTLNMIRQEVGPPLPPLLAPLIATPPRTLRPVSPLRSSCSPSSPASPLNQASPLGDIPMSPVTSPLPEEAGHPSPACVAPSPCTAPASERVLSSPLQFCAATPKHALPVPGRLPPLAPGHTAVGGPPENSVKILDTMYPELSARARTLNILKGNIQLTRGPPADAKSLAGPVSTLTGFKAITSTATAFVKTGGSVSSDCCPEKSRDQGTQQDSAGKRTSAPLLRSAKRLRLDGEAHASEVRTEGAGRNLRRRGPATDAVPANREGSCFVPHVSTATQLAPNPRETVESHDQTIANALRKIAESSFDLLPVIRSHVYVGNISKKPVMRDQEKEVVYEFSTTKKHLAECLLHSILSELNVQKTSADHSYVHALCRVYVGICRQLGDLERARLFCYSILKEDFPESDKLTLFIANMWHDIFISQSVINKAMQLVARQRAKGEVLNCLRAFLNWEKNAPVDVGIMVSKLLLTIQLCPKMEFQSSEKFGEDLSDNAWEYIFAIDLLCCHQKWVWTHDNIISKELWPVMDKWIKYRKGHENITYTPDVIIASVLRLIGRLGQLGLKEGFPSAVKNISSVIGMFIQHAHNEDIPWGVQLAAVYALCDLSPSNPTGISRILETWRKEASQSVPAAILTSLQEAGALCTEEQG